MHSQGATAARADFVRRFLNRLKRGPKAAKPAKPPAGKVRPASSRDLSAMRRAYMKRYLPGGAGDPGVRRGRSLSLHQLSDVSPSDPARSEARQVEGAHRRQSDAAKRGNGQAWPPNRGFEGQPRRLTLPAGTNIDRFGYEGGRFVSPTGTPFAKRALPADYQQKKPYNSYKTTKPITVSAGKAAPWFNQPGGGTQYELPGTVRDHIASGELQHAGGVGPPK